MDTMTCDFFTLDTSLLYDKICNRASKASQPVLAIAVMNMGKSLFPSLTLRGRPCVNRSKGTEINLKQKDKLLKLVYFYGLKINHVYDINTINLKC